MAADDFKAQLSAELDLSKIEQQIADLNNTKITLQVEVEQNAAKRLSESIQRGFKQTKVQFPDMATQLADSFNIKSPKVIAKIRNQVDQLASEMSKAFDGSRINGANLGAGFDQAFNGLSETLAKNSTTFKSQMSQFYKSFYDDYKNMKVYISDAMKDAMGSQYDDIAKSGRIVRDAAKGVNLNEVWDEMSAAHPDILSSQLDNDVDQVFAFVNAMKAAKDELKNALSFDDLDIDLQNEILGDAATSVAGIANQLKSQLEQNIGSAAEQLKSEFLLDITVNQEKLMSDIRQAIQQSAAGVADNPIDISVEINQEELKNKIQSAISGISVENIPINIDENEIRNNIHNAIQNLPLEEVLVTIDDAQLRAEIQRVVGGVNADLNINIDRSQIESELRAALSGVDFPLDFRIDEDDLRDQIRQAIAGMDDLEVDVNVNISNLQDSLRQGIQTLPTQDFDFMNNINRAGREGQDVFSALGSTFRDAFSAYTMANLLERGVDMISDAGREAIQVVKDLNDATTDLMMATGNSRSAVKDMLNDYRDLGNDLGTITLDVAESANEWLRQGKSIEDTTTLIKDSVVLSKVGQIDTSQATEYLTSAANGYKVAVDDVEGIIDKLASVDLAAAYDSGKLAEAMSKTATSADVAGISMDRLIAMIATVGETTQKSASEVGQSFQTIFSRMRNLKAGKLSSIGEDGTIEDLSDVEIVLNELGIKLRSSDGEFRNFQTVLDEVAASWNNWSSVQQAAVAKAFAGTRQQENFLVMMENYDKVLKYTETSANSAGMAQQKFQDAYMSSLEAKTNQLKNSLEELAADTITDEMYAGFLDVASAAADVAKETDLIETAFAGLASGGATYALTHLIRLLRNTATEITALGGGLSGFTQLLMQHPAALVAAGVTAVVGAVNMYQANIEKMVNSAREAGNAWDEQNTSIEANKEKIRELRTALDSGKLTEEEAYRAKSDLLDIQSQLTTSYGEQAQGIDLVNGELETQISLLSQLSQKEAQQFLNENAAGNKVIKNEMEKTRKYGLATFQNGDNEEEVAAIRKAISDAESEYGDFIDFVEDENGAYVDITLNADASTSRDVLNALMTDLTAIEKKFGSSLLIDDMIKNVSSALSDAKGVVEEYAADYEKIINAEMIADEKTYGKEAKTASQWLKDYSKAIKEYNTAVSTGTTDDVAKAAKNFRELDDSIQYLLLNSDLSEYTGQFNTLRDGLNEVAIANRNFQDSFSGNVENTYVKRLADDLKNLNLTDVDFKIAYQTDGLQDGEDIIYSILYAAEDMGIVADAANVTEQELSNVADMLVKIGVLSSYSANNAQTAADEVISSVDAMKTSISDVIKMQDGLNAAMASSVTATGLTTEEIENVTNAYKNLEGYNPEKLFERTANGVHLNTSEVRKLDEQLRQNTMTDFLQAVADKQIELNNAREQGLDTSQLENELSVLQQLASQYDGLTSAYQRWLDAKSGGEEGDMYRSVTDTMIKRGKELYDAELYNSKEFRAIADFYSNQDLTNATAEQVKSAYEQALPAIEKYFTTGREGLDAFVADMKQLSDAEGLGWVTELEDGSLSFNTGSDKEIADRLGIDVEAIQSIYRMMSEYIDGIVIGDTSGLNAFTAQVESAQQKLSEMQQNGEISSSISLDYDVNEMSLDEITAKIEELKGERVEIDAETNPEAAKALDDLIAKTQQAYYFKLNVDTDGGLDKASAAINGIQQRIAEVSAENPVLSVSAIVNGDEEIQTLAEELASLPPEVQTTVGITTENVGNVNGIISQLAQNPESINVPVNYTKGSEPETVDAAEGVANFTLGTSPTTVPDATGKANFKLGTYPTTLPTLTQFVKKVTIESEATGTMLSPAHAKGSVALPQDETALVNELGQESRIHNGIWELLPPGMHVQKLDKGDIILSARQTADLLKSGKAHGIGKAYADGTAFNGMPAHSAGGWTIGGSSSTSTSTSSTIAKVAETTAKKTESAAKKTSKSLDKILEDLEKLFDWIEVLFDRVQAKIDLDLAKADNAVGYENKNALIGSAQNNTADLIEYNEQAIVKYQKQADSVAKKVGLSSSLYKKIKNGTIDIQSLSEKNKKRVEAVKEWYDKVVECQQAVEDLKAEQRELERQKFDNIASEYENLLGLQEALNESIAKEREIREAIGFDPTEEDYYNEINGLMTKRITLEQERIKLENQLKQSLESGEVVVGDDNWSEMQTQIVDVGNKIKDVDINVVEVNNDINNLNLTRLEKMADLLDSITGYLSKKMDFTTASGKYNTFDEFNDTINATYDQYLNSNEQAWEYQQKMWKAQSNGGAADGKTTAEWEAAYYDALSEGQGYLIEILDLQKQMRELPLQKLTDQMNNLKSVINVITSEADLKEAQGHYLTTADYQRQLAATNEEIAKQEAINANNQWLYLNALARGAEDEASEYFDAWKSGEAELNNMKSTVEELSDKIRDDFVESVKRAISAIDDIRSVVESQINIKNSAGKYLDASDYEKQMALNTQEFQRQQQIIADRYAKYNEALIAKNEAEADQMLSEARQAEAAANDLLAANEELQKSIQNLFRDTIQRELDALDAAQRVLESQISLKEAQSRDLTRSDYNSQIDSNMQLILKQQALARENQRLYNLEVSKGNFASAAEYLQAWKDAEAEVNNLRETIENLGDEMRKALLTKELDDLLDKLEQLRASMSTISGIISDDMMYGEDGNLTDFGVTALAMNIKTYESNTESLKALLEKRQKYIDEYNNGMNEYYSRNEFDEDMKDITAEIQSMLTSTNSARQAIVEMILKTSKMEIDALNNVIDKRKELLQAQKDAYDFDKTLKSQTNDLTLLQKQAQALEGLTDKESQAKLQKLNKQIKDAQDALNETITDHSFDLKIDGLDDLKNEISDAYDKYVKELNANLDAITSAVTDATGTVVGALGTVEEAIMQLLNSYGVSGLDTDTIGYTRQYAKGTKYVKDDEWAITQENGQEVIVRPDGSMLTPLKQGSSVINNPMTEKLLSLASNYDAIKDMVETTNKMFNAKQAARVAETEKRIVESQIVRTETQIPVVNINGGIEIVITEPVDGNNVMDVVRKHIKDIASDVGKEFSKNINKAGTRKSWG